MNKKKEFYIWNGIYEKFSDVQVESCLFDSDRWINKKEINSKEMLNDYEKKSKSISKSHDYILPIIVANELFSLDNITILDFGGGLAEMYFQILASNEQDKEIYYHIVENEKIVETGKNIYKEYKNLYFYSELPKSLKAIDILHFGSSLHYVDDWKGLIKLLVSLKPKYIVLSDLLSGDIPTYVTAQKYYDKEMPVWFWNIDDINAYFLSLGYKKIYRTNYHAKILNKIGPLPMSNFPEKYRLEYSCQIVFIKN